ncbi:MAG TPA: PDZ domain-containing protein [Anaerolineae bacterium]
MSKRALKMAGASIALLLLVFAVGVAAGSQTTPVKADAAAALQATLTPQTSEEPGVVIVSVDPDGPAAKAGVKRGDILLSIENTPVNQPADLLRAVRARKAGDSVALTLTHGDEQRTLTATLEDRNGVPYLGVASHGGRSRLDFVKPSPLTGAVIVEVVSGGPADKAGLKAGDRILAVDGTDLAPDQDLAQIIKSHKPGDTLTLKIERPGEEARDVTVTLGENPDAEGEAYLGVKYGPRFDRGFFFNTPKLPEGITGGAFVGEVTSDSPAAKAGLKTGDVITAIDDKSIQTPQDLVDAIAAHKPGDTVTLKVYRAGETAPLTLTAMLGAHPDNADKAYLGVSVGGFFRHFNNDQTPRGFRMPGFRFDFRPPFGTAPSLPQSPVNPGDTA